MVNLNTIQKALPISSLKPHIVAIISGFTDQLESDWWKYSIKFLEPPAGQHFLYVDALNTMELLFKYIGMTTEDAQDKAMAEWMELKEQLELNQKVVFYDGLDMNTNECIPVHRLTNRLHEKNLTSQHIVDFLERSAIAAVNAEIFQGPDESYSIATLPDESPVKAMIEFAPGPSFNLEEETFLKFEEWREFIRPITTQLETALNAPVYYFKIPNCATDDNSVHRFLVLHWICTFFPTSKYVNFLILISGAKDVEELKSALIDPANYRQTVEMHYAFTTINTRLCRIKYIRPNKRKTVGIVFLTEVARQSAELLLLEKINYDVLIVAPPDLMNVDWVKSSTKHNKSWAIQYLHDGILKNPIEILAQIDELCVIADRLCSKQGFDLGLHEAIEGLLWLAIELQIDAHYYFVNGVELLNPKTCLAKSNAPQRVMADQSVRSEFMHQLKEIRLSCDYGSSGLWNEQGQMLRYDLLDLPFPLARRICAWQRDFDEIMNPPATDNEAWWKLHQKEEVSIALELQAILKENVVIKLYRNFGWLSVVEIV